MNFRTDIGQALRSRAPLPHDEDDIEHALTCTDYCCRFTEAEWQELSTLLRARIAERLACVTRPN